MTRDNGNSRRTRPRETTSRSQGIQFTILIAVIVLVYILPRLISFLVNEKVSYVIAKEGTIQESTTVQGVITRQEQLFQSVAEGVLEYYYPGSKALSKNTVVCTIRDNEYYGDLLDQKLDDVYSEMSGISDNEYASAFSELETAAIEQVNGYLRCKDNSAYLSTYSLKEELKSTVRRRQELYSLLSGSQIQKLMQEQGVYQSVAEDASENLWISEAGIIVYSYDGYEGWDASLITPDFIEQYDGGYQYLDINMQQVKAGDALYRLVTSQKWYITVFLTPEQAQKFNMEESPSVSFVCNGSDTMTGTIQSLEAVDSGQYKMVLELSSKVQDYLNERIVTVSFEEDQYEGIKIPDSCLVQQEFYKIPAACIFRSDDQVGVMKRTDEGDIFVAVNFEWNDEDFYYCMLPDNLAPGSTLLQQNSDETTQVRDNVTSNGVYIVNAGNQVFQRVEVLYQSKGYSVVSGIEPYDHVLIVNEE